MRGKCLAEWKFILGRVGPFRFPESLFSGDDMQPIRPYWFETDQFHFQSFGVCGTTHESTLSRIGTRRVKHIRISRKRIPLILQTVDFETLSYRMILAYLSGTIRSSWAILSTTWSRRDLHLYSQKRTLSETFFPLLSATK